jgi:hypothetical protein
MRCAKKIVFRVLAIAQELCRMADMLDYNSFLSDYYKLQRTMLPLFACELSPMV